MNAGNKIKVAAVLKDATLRAILCDGIASHAGVKVLACDSLPAAIIAVADSKAAVVLLDSPSVESFGLPENPGLLALMISARNGADLPPGFSAQNVFIQPLRLGLLLDRIARHGIARQGAAFSLGAYLVSPDTGTLTEEKSGKVVTLTEKERHILLKLYERRGETVDRRELLGDIWGYAEGIETHTLETHIYRLRQKIEDDPAKPQWLLTDEEGYRLVL
jgi:DNA-binding response OmpR family regulator